MQFVYLLCKLDLGDWKDYEVYENYIPNWEWELLTITIDLNKYKPLMELIKLQAIDATKQLQNCQKPFAVNSSHQYGNLE